MINNEESLSVLVTGGAGYTGLPLVMSLLDAGHNVTILDDFSAGSAEVALWLQTRRALHVVCGSVVDGPLVKALVRGADAVFHLAGISGQPACAADPVHARRVNVDGTRAVVDACDGRAYLVNASTTSLYGTVRNERDGTEGADLAPRTVYGLTKLEAEEIARGYPNAVSIRWATIFGLSPKMRHALYVQELVASAARDGEVTVYDPGSRRTFLHVQDQSAGYLTVLRRRPTGVLNMGDDRLNLTKLQVAEAIRAELGCEIRLDSSPSGDERDFHVSYARAVTELDFHAWHDMGPEIRRLAYYYHAAGRDAE